jgi:hypothetical protein
MARSVRLRPYLLVQEDGADLIKITSDSGARTFTKMANGQINLAVSAESVTQIYRMTEGNFMYVHCSSGPVWVNLQNAAPSATAGFALKSNGWCMMALATFTNFRIKNGQGSTTTTIDYWVGGD